MYSVSWHSITVRTALHDVTDDVVGVVEALGVRLREVVSVGAGAALAVAAEGVVLTQDVGHVGLRLVVELAALHDERLEVVRVHQLLVLPLLLTLEHRL